MFVLFIFKILIIYFTLQHCIGFSLRIIGSSFIHLIRTDPNAFFLIAE